jgi:hypothetical protein
MTGLLKAHSFLSFLSDQTLALLAFELIKIKKFPAHSLIMKQSKRSLLNLHYKTYFENRMSNLKVAMNEEKVKLMDQEEDIKIS